MWCRNYSLIFAQSPDEWRAAADEWRGGLVVRRRGEESDGLWLSGRVTARLQDLFQLFMSSERFTPFPPFPFLPPPSLFCSTPLFNFLHFSFNTFYLLVNDFPAPFLAFDFGSPSSTLLLFSPTLFKYPINWLMCSAVLDAQPGVVCDSVGRVSFHSVMLWFSTNMTNEANNVFLDFSKCLLVTFLNCSWAARSNPTTAFLLMLEVILPASQSICITTLMCFSGPLKSRRAKASASKMSRNYRL